ncbi:hypothetical protein F4861DRAFT_497891, partial [Xylaria intraflava]
MSSIKQSSPGWLYLAVGCILFRADHCLVCRPTSRRCTLQVNRLYYTVAMPAGRYCRTPASSRALVFGLLAIREYRLLIGESNGTYKHDKSHPGLG